MNRAIRRRSIPLWWLALAAALSLLLTIHDTFVIAVFEGYISWCIPYWDSCTSISRTGRYCGGNSLRYPHCRSTCLVQSTRQCLWMGIGATHKPSCALGCAALAAKLFPGKIVDGVRDRTGLPWSPTLRADHRRLVWPSEKLAPDCGPADTLTLRPTRSDLRIARL